MKYEGKMSIRQAAYTKHVICLWEEVVRTVYLNEPSDCYAQEMALEAWEQTNMSPLEYVIHIANPRSLTNKVLKGQKAREKRWDKWLKAQTGE